MLRMHRGWHSYRGAIILLLVLMLLALPKAALAQSGPDCEDPQTVACLPTSGGASGGAAAASSGSELSPAPASAAPGNVAAAPALPPVPAPCPLVSPAQPAPPPYIPPLPADAAAAPAIAPPVAIGPIAPPGCPFDIYSTINRANLVYARAMRSLDGSSLSTYWSGDALQQLLGQIDQLESAGVYRVLRLSSIQMEDESVQYGQAWVHTSEHWSWQTRTADGQEYDHGDGWYDNYYFLYRPAGGGWRIYGDRVY